MRRRDSCPVFRAAFISRIRNLVNRLLLLKQAKDPSSVTERRCLIF